MKDIVLEVFDKNKNHASKLIKKNHPELYEKIINLPLYAKQRNVSEFTEKAFIYVNDITTQPICKGCNSPVSFWSFKYGYSEFCSQKCTTNDLEYKEKLKKSMIEKYGVDNPSKSDDIKEKKKQTLLQNYGVEYNRQSKEINNKVINTFIEKYGVDNPSKSEEIKEKKKQTLLEHFGYENPNQVPEIKERIKKTQFSNNYDKLLSLSNHIFPNFNKEEYVGNHISYNWNCQLCNKDFSTFIRNIHSCPYCEKTISKGHKEINDLLDSMGILYNINDRTIITPLELDVYIPNSKLAIEFCGLYWHNERTKPEFYHKFKMEKCINKNINLLTIFEDEWTYNKEICISKIKHILNKNNSQKIYARNCVIKELNKKECEQFLTENHIQGYINSKYKLGLFLEDELVSVMTIGKDRFTKNRLEILRIATKKRVIGGPSKLFSYFIKKYSPEEIVTYKDLRWGNHGNFYEKMGFVFEKNTRPNYWYIKNGKRFHRFNFRKSELIKQGFDPNKTEKEIMLERGYNRIWDCGHAKYVWKST